MNPKKRKSFAEKLKPVAEVTEKDLEIPPINIGISCEDTYIVKEYFEIFGNQINGNRLKLEIKETPAGSGESSPKHLIERIPTLMNLLKISNESLENVSVWLVVDRDNWHGNQLEAVSNCCRTSEKTYGIKVQLAYSDPCFAYWLMLHFVTPEKIGMNQCGELEHYLRTNVNCLDSTGKQLAAEHEIDEPKLKQAYHSARQQFSSSQNLHTDSFDFPADSNRKTMVWKIFEPFFPELT